MSAIKQNNERKHVYLSVDKAYFGSGLKPVEILIMSQIDEYIEKGLECYITNEQFASDLNVDIKTIKRALDKLEDNGYIERNTNFCSGNGHCGRKRTINRGHAWYKTILPNRTLLDGKS